MNNSGYYKKVALVAVPAQDTARPPIALAILGAACEEYNIEYDIYDFNLWLKETLTSEQWDLLETMWRLLEPKVTDPELYSFFLEYLDQYVDFLLARHPTMIGISVFTNRSLTATYEMCINIRRKNADVCIVIGGTGINASSWISSGSFCEHMLENKLIDYYVYGEGEESFRSILRGEYGADGINNQRYKQLDDLSKYPYPSYKKASVEKYKIIGRSELIINGSRGCVLNCLYCDVGSYWKKYKFKPGTYIADEMYHYFKALGVSKFEFSDSLVNGSISEFRKMNDRLVELMAQDPSFTVEYSGQFICRPSSSVKEDDYAIMSKAGAKQLHVGVESFSDSVRFHMGKKFTNKDLDFHLAMCAKYGIRNSLLMIMGWPTETEEDHQENLAALEKYQKYALAGVISILAVGHTTSVDPGAPLSKLKEELGLSPIYEDADILEQFNWVPSNNATLTLTQRFRRWHEFTSRAVDLNYPIPRLDSTIASLREVLRITKDKKIIMLDKK